MMLSHGDGTPPRGQLPTPLTNTSIGRESGQTLLGWGSPGAGIRSGAGNVRPPGSVTRGDWHRASGIGTVDPPVCHQHWPCTWEGDRDKDSGRDRDRSSSRQRGSQKGRERSKDRIGKPSGAGTRPVNAMGECDTGSGEPFGAVTGAGPVRAHTV